MNQNECFICSYHHNTILCYAIRSISMIKGKEKIKSFRIHLRLCLSRFYMRRLCDAILVLVHLDDWNTRVCIIILEMPLPYQKYFFFVSYMYAVYNFKAHTTWTWTVNTWSLWTIRYDTIRYNISIFIIAEWKTNFVGKHFIR